MCSSTVIYTKYIEFNVEKYFNAYNLFFLIASGIRHTSRREPFRKLVQSEQLMGSQQLVLLRWNSYYNYRYETTHTDTDTINLL